MNKKTLFLLSLVALTFFILINIISSHFFKLYIESKVSYITYDEFKNSPKPWDEPLNNSAYQGMKGFTIIGNEAYYKYYYLPNNYCLIKPDRDVMQFLGNVNFMRGDEKGKDFNYNNPFKNSFNTLFCEINFDSIIGYAFITVSLYLFFSVLYVIAFIYKWRKTKYFSIFILLLNSILLAIYLLLMYIIAPNITLNIG